MSLSKSRVCTNNLCVEHPYILCGKLCVICVATYVYDTLLYLWQLMCYMCGNLCARHLLFSGNFYITSVATSYKIFFGNSCAWHFFWTLWQLLCITNYDFMVNFFFSWQLEQKNVIFLLQLLLYKCGNLCVDTLTIYVIAYNNLVWGKIIIKLYTSGI